MLLKLGGTTGMERRNIFGPEAMQMRTPVSAVSTEIALSLH
jgi:hypothetical protein